MEWFGFFSQDWELIQVTLNGKVRDALRLAITISLVIFYLNKPWDFVWIPDNKRWFVKLLHLLFSALVQGRLALAGIFSSDKAQRTLWELLMQNFPSQQLSQCQGHPDTEGLAPAAFSSLWPNASYDYIAEASQTGEGKGTLKPIHRQNLWVWR